MSTMADRMRVVIVDDEPLARNLLRSMLASRAGFDVVGEAASGREAVATINELRPDLVLLDVQMPELDGFGVVEAVGAAQMPDVVFVTAYDQYALRAFDVHALDYLLKPFDADRLSRALERAVERRRQSTPRDLEHRLAELLGELRDASTHLTRITVKSDGRIRFVNTETIDWIEADGKIARLHAGKDVHEMRETMTTLEQRLDPRQFVRVHRSAIVNVSRIREMQPWFQGDYVLILNDGTKVTTGRAYRENVRRLLGEGSA